jgi:hypothetical protein
MLQVVLDAAQLPRPAAAVATHARSQAAMCKQQTHVVQPLNFKRQLSLTIP